MPEKKTDDDVRTSAETKADTKAKADVQSVFDEAHEKGYFGTVPDPIPNERYSLASGPDSPSVTEVAAATAAATDTKEG